jgi:cell division protein FtsL
MARLNILLTTALVLCALLLVTSQHRARRLNIELESAQGQEQELHVRTRQLELKISEYAKASLIDSRVRKELKMISLTPERTLYLKAPD